MSRPSLLVFLLVITTPTPTGSHRRWRSEKVIEGLYLNKTNGCDGYVSRSQRSVCAHIKNLPEILRSATLGAIAFCKKIFQYEHWPCRIDEKIFAKASREQAFLTSLLAWSVSQVASLFCTKGELHRCWQSPRCSDVITRGTNVATHYFLTGGIGFDIIGQMMKHNIKNGIQASRKTECIRFNPFHDCKIRISWPPALTNENVAEIFISKYHSAYKWETNSAQFNEVNKKKKQLLYLKDSEESCDVTRNRRCRDPDNCSYLCCGRGFVKHKTLRRLIDCNCLFEPFVVCEKCLDYKVIYICR